MNGRQKPVQARIALLFILVAGCSGLSAQENKPAEIWAPWQFLMGEWVGVGAGPPGAGTGKFSFQPDLDAKILVRKNRTEYPAKPGEKTGSVHEDLMIVYRLPEEKNFRAIYFDNEGHVIRYSAVFGSENSSVVLESDGTHQETRFRLTYRLRRENDLEIVFSIAPPGQEYKTYLQGYARRRP